LPSVLIDQGANHWEETREDLSFINDQGSLELAQDKFHVSHEHLKIGRFFKVEVFAFQEMPGQGCLAALPGTQNQDSRELFSQFMDEGFGQSFDHSEKAR